MTATEQRCPYCSFSPATIAHCVWECGDNPHRGDLVPQSRMQECLGWPCGRSPGHDAAVLKCFAGTRADVLAARRPRSWGLPLRGVGPLAPCSQLLWRLRMLGRWCGRLPPSTNHLKCYNSFFFWCRMGLYKYMSLRRDHWLMSFTLIGWFACAVDINDWSFSLTIVVGKSQRSVALYWFGFSRPFWSFVALHHLLSYYGMSCRVVSRHLVSLTRGKNCWWESFTNVVHFCRVIWSFVFIRRWPELLALAIHSSHWLLLLTPAVHKSRW